MWYPQHSPPLGQDAPVEGAGAGVIVVVVVVLAVVVEGRHRWCSLFWAPTRVMAIQPMTASQTAWEIFHFDNNFKNILTAFQLILTWLKMMGMWNFLCLRVRSRSFWKSETSFSMSLGSFIFFSLYAFFMRIAAQLIGTNHMACKVSWPSSVSA